MSITYGVAVVAVRLGGTVAELRAGLGLNAAPGLASGVVDRAGVDLRTSTSLVGALGGDEAREGRSGDHSSGVEHDACEVWRSGVMRQQQCLRRNRPPVRCCGRAARSDRQCVPGCLERRLWVSMAEAQGQLLAVEMFERVR